MKKKVLYISKYALNKEQNGPSRQYLFSTYFAKKGYKTYLISSNSNGFKFLDFEGDYRLYKNKDLEHYVLKGSAIKLGFNVKRILSWIIFEIRVLKFLKKIEVNKGDILIVSSLSILTFLTGVYLKKKHKIRLIVEVRDIWPLTLIEFKNLSKYNPIVMALSLIEKKAYREADFIVGSMGNLGAHINNIDLSLKDKFRYIPMGYEPSFFSHDRSKKSKKNEHRFVVGYAGTVGRANKVELILESAELLNKERKIIFKILGDGALKKSLMQKYKHLKNVIFLEKVEKKKVDQFLQNCDILLNPWEDLSIYQYGVSPNKWIDYMYAEKPIIVPFNGFKSIINEANCGEFISTNDPELLAKIILKYYSFPKEELIEIGKRGKVFLEERLNYNALTEKYIKLFK